MPEAGPGGTDRVSGSGFRPWRVAWADALYGERGFYRRAEGPRGHFETSANAPGGVVELLAEALVALAEQHGCTEVVDVGAGRGELLGALASATSRASRHRADDPTGALGLTGVDVVRRPPGLPDRVRWLESPGGMGLPAELRGLDQVLVVAHEWLDVVPCDVLEVDPDGVLRVVEVDPMGRERLGPEPSGAQLDWCARWWPVSALEPGARIEVGLARDAAWADLVSRVRSGVLLAVDYGHLAEDRPPQGSLAAHRAGRLVPPVPDGSCDLTAELAWDSLLVAGAAAATSAAASGPVGAAMMQRRVTCDAPLHQSGPDRGDQPGAAAGPDRGDQPGAAAGPDRGGARLTTQRAALTGLGVDAGRPARPADHANDPAAYLIALQRSAAAATLLDPGGLGGLDWLVQQVATGQADPRPARVEA